MSTFGKRVRAQLALLVAGSVAGVGLLAGGVPPAVAAPQAVQSPTNGFTADRLPTVQIDGVAWSQAVVGNTVYAGGRFNNARPAGAAAGTNLTARGNLLAYDISTGNLITSFAPSLNGQVLGVTASPDGTRIYVVGDFTTANGQARRRVAAYSTANGQLISTFNPSGPNSQARSVVATNDTVYVGGGFLGLANGTLRNNLVAYRASDGAVLPWNPSATGTANDATAAVWALGVSADGASVFAGGQFQNVGGQPAYGLAKISGSGAGALDTTWQPSVRNAGKDAGISSLRVQGDKLFGTTWHFGPGGNLEGTFKAPIDGASDSTDIEWVTDCHGDVYSSYLNDGVVYTAGHAHYCGNMGGGFPQYSAWQFQHAQAWSDTQTGDILNEVHGYPNWHGQEPGPAMVNWLPDMAIGNFTGQYQAGWNVTGNDNYLAFGGEFPRVNGVNQQGLVRFAKRAIAPKTEGPRFATTSFSPRLVPTSATSVRVSWPAGYDRDDQTLTYKAYRTGVATPRHQVDAKSQWWNLPQMGFTDTGLTPGATYTYRIVVNDPGGNTVNGSTVSVTMPTTFGAATAYANKIRADGARIYWPLNETSGTTVTDRAAGPATAPGIGVTDGRADTGVTWGQAGAIPTDAAASLGDNDWSRVFAGNCAQTAGCQWATETAPDTFTSQVWIKTSTTSGGRVLGFGDLQNGNSGHRDRHIYMTNSGQLVFGVRAPDGGARTVSSARPYNDNAWHMVTATMGPQGMALYVDGVRVGRRVDTTQGESYLGYWRLGGDNLGGWSGQPSTANFVGSADEVAVYPTALSQDQIVAQYEASGRASVIPAAPADTLGAAVYADEPDLFWRLGEASGTKAVDSGKALNDGTYRNGPTLGQAGVIAENAAARFDGADDLVSSDGEVANPTVYTEEAWFNTTTSSGGKIIGFGNNQNGNSGAYDRHIYMQDDGKLVFGTWTGQGNTILTPGSYNDGTWHHLVASQSSSGMKLYVDGVLVGTHPQTAAQDYSGFWKVGGDNTWGSSSAYFNGLIDEVAVYSYELSAERALAHFTAGGGKLNQNPTAAFVATTDQRRATFDAAGSSDPDGTVATYTWDFGDGATGTGQRASHVYAAAGRYDVKLTVADNKGGTATATQAVQVTVPPAPVDAYGAAVYNDKPLLFWRLDESSGPKATDAGGGATHGTYRNGVTLSQPGALPNSTTAARFDGNNGFVSSDDSFANPTTYTEEAWFKTNTTRGGKIIGFGSSKEGSSGSYDRHVYMQDDGHLVFGTYTGVLNTIVTPASYHNDQWHHVVASQSSDGMKLYVDGALVGTNPQVNAQNYDGFWKVGGDNTWGSSSAYFDGTIDEVAVYQTELSAARVAAHYAAAQPAPNQAPTAEFSTTKSNLAVSTNASASTDPDGTIVDYRWDFGDTWTTTGPTASHTYAKAGTYEITLTVTDDDGSTSSVKHSVSVVAPNQAPTASFTAATDHLAVSLDASGSADPDGTVADYAWDFGDATTGSGKTTTHTYTKAGSYVVTLTVTDDDGGTDTTTKTIEATEPPNLPPTPAFTSSTDGLRLTVDGSASTDTDGTIASYRWDFGDGTPPATTATATHTYAEPGEYDVRLTVTDNDGSSAWTTKKLTVTRGNQSPVAAFSASAKNLTVDLDAAASGDPDGTIASYSWNFGDGTAPGSGQTSTHTYAAAGNYLVTLTVTDNDGATATAVKEVVATEPANDAPTARFTSSSANLTATLNASTSSDPDGSIVGYSWNFGDQTSGTGVTTTHHYGSAGTYTVTLTVTDNKGATGTVSQAVTVTAPAVIAADNFERTSTNSWGSAQTGGAWTTGGTASNYNVANGAGTMRMTAGLGPSAYLNATSASAADLTTSFNYDKAGTGGGVYTSLVGRRIGTSDYRAKVRVTATDTTVYLVRMVNGTETTLSSQVVPGMVITANETVSLRLQVFGTGTTTLRVKIWEGTTEPTAWRLTSTDTTAGLQAAGSMGIYSYLSGSATNAPVVVRVLDFRAEPIG